MRRGKETLLTTTDTLRRVMAGGEGAVAAAPAAFEASLSARS